MLDVQDMDGFDDLTPEQQDLAQEYFAIGYDDGYDEGYEIAESESTLYEDGKTAGFEEGYQKGFEYEQQRIHSILEMQMKWAEQEGKGNEYLRWKNVKEYLTPINFEPWTEEQWQEELAKDGF
jgi:hypothetical protein